MEDSFWRLTQNLRADWIRSECFKNFYWQNAWPRSIWSSKIDNETWTRYNQLSKDEYHWRYPIKVWPISIPKACRRRWWFEFTKLSLVQTKIKRIFKDDEKWGGLKRMWYGKRFAWNHRAAYNKWLCSLLHPNRIDSRRFQKQCTSQEDFLNSWPGGSSYIKARPFKIHKNWHKFIWSPLCAFRDNSFHERNFNAFKTGFDKKWPKFNPYAF